MPTLAGVNCPNTEWNLSNSNYRGLDEEWEVMQWLLFFLWFPLCRGEAGLLVTAKYGYFRNLLPLVSVVGLFSPFIFLLCLGIVSINIYIK